jgi:hypothetical protein
MKRAVGRYIWVTWILILVFFSIGAASAEESAAEQAWEFNAKLYFWGASIGGKSTSGSDVDIEIDDILDSLEFAVMGVAAVRKGKWSLNADVIYLDMAGSSNVAPGVRASVDLSGWVVTPFAGYNLIDSERLVLDILVGPRYLYLKADLKAGAARAKDSGYNWDGVIGVRGDVNLTEKWFLPYHLDVGTGDSQVTWQAFGGIGYRFEWFDAAAAYRYLRWDFDDNKTFDDLYFHGPFVGIRFSF